MNIHDDLYKHVSEQSPLLYELWEPEETAVVVGYSQTPSAEAHLTNCENDGIAVIKRRGGGGAVVLMPGVLCLTFAFLSSASISPYYFFRRINGFLIDALERYFCIAELDQRGISDIAIDGKKVLGCSIFKSRNLFFYQGSLLVKPELQLISRYLLHPSKEPDYRRGRPHSDFVTSLEACGYPLSVGQIKTAIETEIAANFLKIIS
jgi:lipoate-protein ligase A